MRGMMILAVALALGACSGGKKAGSADAADATPPVVTLSAPTMTVEGGEAVIITVTAIDNRDPTVIPALTCDGGTLTGTVLSTAPVTDESKITCRATASDAAGNAGSGTLVVTVRPTIATLALGRGYTTLNAGQYGVLLADNLPLEQASYQGTIDGKAVTLTRGLSNTLLYRVPTDVVAGSRQLTLTLGARTYSFALTVTDAPAVTDARATVRTFLQDRLAYWNVLTSDELAAMSAAQRSEIADGKVELTNALANLDVQPADEVQDAARFLIVNRVVGANGVAALAYDRAECLTRTGAFLTQAVKAATIKTISYPALAIDWLRGVIGNSTRTALGSYARQEEARVKTLRASMVAVCMAPRGIKLEPFNASGQSLRTQSQNVVRALAANAKLGFEDKKPAWFRAYQLEAMTDDIQNSLRGPIRSLIEAFGSDPGDFLMERSTLIPPGELSMGPISHEAVDGSTASVGELLQLTFEAVGAEEDNIDFTFDLRRTNGDVYPVSGHLTLKLPEADPVTIDVRQNSDSTQPLVTRGGRRVELINGAAKNGTFTLNGCCNDNFSFTYVPNAGFFGQELLQYRTYNDTGYSKPASIVININRDFTGTWNVAIRERVSAQSRPNLCASSDRQSTIAISKLSPFSYIANYSGFQIPLTHANPLGPQGLVGSLEGEYDEDGGETSERLSVEVPDSTHLSGSSTWTWRGPNGASCSGTTEITGTRP